MTNLSKKKGKILENKICHREIDFLRITQCYKKKISHVVGSVRFKNY